jgi:hypothetical protein
MRAAVHTAVAHVHLSFCEQHSVRSLSHAAGASFYSGSATQLRWLAVVDLVDGGHGKERRWRAKCGPPAGHYASSFGALQRGVVVFQLSSRFVAGAEGRTYKDESVHT